MTIEETIRKAVERVADAHGIKTTEAELERAEKAYAERSADPSYPGLAMDAIQLAQLGEAAYALGVHYSLHNHARRAEHWLRIAADRGVGDASLRLARFYEREAVDRFGKSLDGALPSDTDEQFSEAFYWYHLAAAAGYGRNDYYLPSDLEDPVLNLDCCPAAQAASAYESAAEIRNQAAKDALLTTRRARADVRFVVAQARNEINDLAIERQLLEERIGEYEETVRVLARVASRRKSVGRHVIWLLIRSKFNGRLRNNLRHLYAVYSLAAVAESGKRSRRESSTRESTDSPTRVRRALWRFGRQEEAGVTSSGEIRKEGPAGHVGAPELVTG